MTIGSQWSSDCMQDSLETSLPNSICVGVVAVNEDWPFTASVSGSSSAALGICQADLYHLSRERLCSKWKGGEVPLIDDVHDWLICMSCL